MALTLKQQQVKNLFIYTDHPQIPIAALLHIDRKPFRLWVKKDMREQFMRSAEQTSSIILQNTYKHIYHMNKKITARNEDDLCPLYRKSKCAASSSSRPKFFLRNMPAPISMYFQNSPYTSSAKISRSINRLIRYVKSPLWETTMLRLILQNPKTQPLAPDGEKNGEF